jgi:hypothetical protein
MADTQPEHPGCELCSYTDGGCSACNPRSVFDRMAEDDAYEDSMYDPGEAAQ